MDNNISGGLGNHSSPRDRERDRNRRGDRQSRFSDAGGGGSNDRDRSRERRGPTSRIYVSNIPYEYRWQDLKDLCRDMVGDVNFVELFNDENHKPRGCGIVEFKSTDSVALAMEKLNRHEINGRQIVIKEDYGDERDECGRVIRGSGGGGGGGGGGGSGNPNRGGGGGMGSGSNAGGGYNRDRDDDRPRGIGGNLGGGGGGGGGIMNVFGGGNSGGGGGGGGPMNNDYDGGYNTYGLSTSFLESLGIQGPLHNKVFVANLDYMVDAKKLKQVFKLAGRIVSVDLSVDKDGKSRGFAVVEYDHPVEAVQAISMFERQVLFDRRMIVRMDRIPDKGESIKLPEGLKGIGTGLGPNGEPLRNVAFNLRSMSSGGNNQNSSSAPPSIPMNGGGVGGGVGAPNPSAAAAAASAAASLLGPVPNNTLSGLSSNLAALSSVVNFSNLSGALSNPLLSSTNLNSLGLGALGNPSGAGDQGNNQQGGNPLSGGGGGFNANQGFQTYNTPAFNSNLGSLASRNRNDYDMGGVTGGGGGGGGNQGQNNSVRSYNTQSDDYDNRGGGGGGGGGGQGSNNNSFGNSVSNVRKSDTIVIKNLPPTCHWQMLRDKFRGVGEVKFAEIRGQDTGVVRFSKEMDAELAIKLMDGSRVDNQIVYVSYF